MLWLVAVLGQLQGVKVEEVIGISTIISSLLQHSCEQVQIQYFNREKKKTHFLQ